MIASGFKINDACTSDISKLEKESEKCKIIAGCLIALAVIITGILIGLFFILPLVAAISIAFTLCLLSVVGLCWGGSHLIYAAQEDDETIFILKQQNKESITSEEEDITLQTRRQKADLSNVDLGKLPGEEESITLEPQEVGESQIKRRQFSSNVDVERVLQ